MYRAINRDGNLVDGRLSRQRDRAAAKTFFREALAVTKICPDRVTTDGHKSYSAAIKAELGDKVKHRTNQYLNNRLEQDPCGIKQRYYPMRDFNRLHVFVGLSMKFVNIFGRVHAVRKNVPYTHNDNFIASDPPNWRQ